MNSINQLHDDILLKMLSFLPSTKDVVSTMVLSKRWQHLWTFVPRLLYDDSYRNPEYLRFSRFMLVTLRLSNAVLVDVDYPMYFACLKKLSLVSIKYPSDEFVNRLLSGCPVLKDLFVKRNLDDNVTMFNIVVPSLKIIVLEESWNMFVVEGIEGLEAHGFVIDAPSLEFLDVFDSTDGVFVIRSNMPKIVEANVILSCDHPEQILGSITCVKRLSLCVKDPYPDGRIFCSLVSLTICTCETVWLNVLVNMLRDSPKLQALKFEKCRGPEALELRPGWIEPSSVPECLLTSLETVECVKYKGTEEEKQVVAFILRSEMCLKRVTINSNYTSSRKKFRMIKELSFSPRRSPICRLDFD
ncbi:unnamed protein product [Cochlearia groenlandica]